MSWLVAKFLQFGKPMNPSKDQSTKQQHEEIWKLFAQPVSTTNYLCHWSPRLKYVYVETPKVACTTVKRVLQQAESKGSYKLKNPGDVHNRDTSPLASPSKDVDGFVKAIHDDDFFKFCFVRNPFTRTLSCYLDKMVNTEYERIRLAPKLGISTTHIPTFREFLEIIAEQTDEQRDIHWASQTYLLRPNRVKYSFIGRFEIFRDHFKLVCEHLQISEYASDLSSSWHATNAYEKIKDYMGDTEIDLICRIYESDFRNFGYGWSPVVC